MLKMSVHLEVSPVFSWGMVNFHVYASDQKVLKASSDSPGLELELETQPLQQVPGSADATGLWTTL